LKQLFLGRSWIDGRKQHIFEHYLQLRHNNYNI